MPWVKTHQLSWETTTLIRLCTLKPVGLMLNMGAQGVKELFYFSVNNKSLEVVNNACQSMVLPV